MNPQPDEDVVPATSPLPDDPAAAAAALEAAARRAVDAEDYATARAAFERELVLRRQLGDTNGIIYALLHVAWVRRVGQGEISAARPPLEEALAIARERSPEHLSALAWNLGDQALSEGDFATADRLLRESLAAAASGPRDAGTMGGALEGVAMAAAGQGRWVRALRVFGAASALREAAGIPQVQPAVVARFDRFFGPARTALGPTSAAVAEAQGRSLRLDQAIAEALGGTAGEAHDEE